MKIKYILPIVSVFTIFAASCSSSMLSVGGKSSAGKFHTDTLAESGVFDCPVTKPPKSAFVPPVPWPSVPPESNKFWYGDNGLWTALPVSGSWTQLALGEKFWWWSEEFDVTIHSTPDLTVTARRLDGESPPFETSEATNGFHESFNWAMLVGVELDSPGCWEFTGKYKDHQLTFVLFVPAE